jgi:hypothetical protein
VCSQRPTDLDVGMRSTREPVHRTLGPVTTKLSAVPPGGHQTGGADMPFKRNVGVPDTKTRLVILLVVLVLAVFLL